MKKFVIVMIVVMMVMIPVMAQEEQTDLAFESVAIEATDGLTLVGDFYRPEAGEAGSYSAVILLHMLGSNRQAWKPLIPVLVNDYGLAVLNMDMRGHGETGGGQDWTQAEADVQLMINWLREKPEVTEIAIMGGSIGSNLALRGAANDPTVKTAVALSPGLDYRGVTTAEAIAQLADNGQPVLLMAARGDTYSADSVVELFNLSDGAIAVRMYTSRAHGTALLGSENPALMHLLGLWLTEHLQPEE